MRTIMALAGGQFEDIDQAQTPCPVFAFDTGL